MANDTYGQTTTQTEVYPTGSTVGTPAHTPTYGHQYPAVRPTETRKSFLTTEFWVFVVMTAGVLIAAYADGDSLKRSTGWLYATLLGFAYLLSRGIAKAGSRETRFRDRDDD
jgi:hypothetical protein